jgi:hypothetical protein
MTTTDEGAVQLILQTSLRHQSHLAYISAKKGVCLSREFTWQNLNAGVAEIGSGWLSH